MYRFVDKPKGIFWFSTILNGSAGITVIFFGVSAVMLFWVACAGMAFVSHALRRTEEDQRRR